MNRNINKMKNNIITIITFIACCIICSCTTKSTKTYPSGNPSEVLEPNTYNIVQEKYKTIKRYQKGTAVVKQNLCGLIDEHGQELLPCIYDSIYSLTKSFRLIIEKGSYGLINVDGDLIKECKYSDAYDFGVDYVALKMNDKWGIVDKNGQDVTQYKYDRITQVTDSVFVGVYDGLWGVIKYDGSIVIPFEYDEIWYKTEKANPITLVSKNKKWGIYNKDNILVLDCLYDRISPIYLSNRYISISTNPTSSYKTKRAGLVDSQTGEIMIPLEYMELGNYSEGLVFAENMNEKYGYLDSVGNVIIPFIYEDASDFSEGLAAVFKKSGYANTIIGIQPTHECGYIDKEGKEVIPFKFKSTFSANMCEFHNSRAVQGTSSDNIHATVFGYIDKKGEWVVTPKYRDAKEFKDGFAEVSYDGENAGLIDTEGKEILPFKYDTYSYWGLTKDSLIRMKQNGKEYYFDLNGRPVIR